MGNVRGISNTAPMRLVSPAPVLVNAATTGNLFFFTLVTFVLKILKSYFPPFGKC